MFLNAFPSPVLYNTQAISSMHPPVGARPSPSTDQRLQLLVALRDEGGVQLRRVPAEARRQAPVGHLQQEADGVLSQELVGTLQHQLPDETHAEGVQPLHGLMEEGSRIKTLYLFCREN